MSLLGRRTFLDIMGSMPSGVAVVTTLGQEGRPAGLTVSAVCSVSAEPPMLLVSINGASRTLGALRANGRFAVNFLRGDRADVARRFSSPVADRFDGIEWRATPLGSVVLFADSVSYAGCRIVDDIVAGDHVILVGLAEEGSPPPPQSTPLAYFRRTYGMWPAPHDDAEGSATQRGRPTADRPQPAAGQPQGAVVGRSQPSAGQGSQRSGRSER